MGLFPESEIDRKIKSGHKWSDKTEFFQDYYQSLEGKRDVWAWFYGFGTPLLFVIVAVYEYSSLKAQSIPKWVLNAFLTWDIVSFGIILLVCIPFFVGQKWARKAMYLLPVAIIIAFNIIMDNVLISSAKSQLTGSMIGRSIIGLLVYAAITLSSVPNKAFFRISCKQSEIERYWNAVSNKYARYAAIVGIFFPLLVGALRVPLISLLISFEIIENGSIVAKALTVVFIVISCGFLGWLCLKAFKNYSPNTIPPIKGRIYAVFGLVAAFAWVGFSLTTLVSA